MERERYRGSKRSYYEVPDNRVLAPSSLLLMHTKARTYAHSQTHTHTHVWRGTQSLTHTQTQICTYTHTHTHTGGRGVESIIQSEMQGHAVILNMRIDVPLFSSNTNHCSSHAYRSDLPWVFREKTACSPVHEHTSITHRCLSGLRPKSAIKPFLNHAALNEYSLIDTSEYALAHALLQRRKQTHKPKQT